MTIRRPEPAVHGVQDGLQRFTRLHSDTLRGASVRPLHDLSFPNPSRCRDPRGVEALRQAARSMTDREFQYTPLGGAILPRRKVAESLRPIVGAEVAYRDVTLAPGGTAALCIAFETLFRPGDEVVVTAPCWMDYPDYLERFGVRTVLVPATADKRLDVDAIALAWNERTAGLVVTQPNCPTGVVEDDATLSALGERLRWLGERWGRVPLLVADEVHRDQAWSGAGCPSPLRHYADAVTVYSFGKAWGLQGQRTGYVAVHPQHRHRDRLRAELEHTARRSGFCAPTALMQHVMARLARLTPDVSGLATDQREVREALRDCGVDVVAAEASVFVYVRAPSGWDDWSAVTALAEQGVLTMPSSIFHEPGHVRFALNEPGMDATELAARVRVAWRLQATVPPDTPRPAPGGRDL